MPSFKIVKKVEPKKTFRVASVIDSFDLTSNKVTQVFEGSLEIENDDWNVGVVFGASGTGKTTIAKEVLGDNYYVPDNYGAESILDDMPKGKSVEEITRAFGLVGFGSVPSWLKPYNVLSNGEKMRVDLARAILDDKDCVVFDEFTSVVDRQVAKIGSTCIQKAIRKKGSKFIAVTCHNDIIDWLQPDWVFNTNDMTFKTFRKKKDQKSKSKYTNATESYGDFLVSITI